MNQEGDGGRLHPPERLTAELPSPLQAFARLGYPCRCRTEHLAAAWSTVESGRSCPTRKRPRASSTTTPSSWICKDLATGALDDYTDSKCSSTPSLVPSSAILAWWDQHVYRWSDLMGGWRSLGYSSTTSARVGGPSLLLRFREDRVERDQCRGTNSRALRRVACVARRRQYRLVKNATHTRPLTCFRRHEPVLGARGLTTEAGSTHANLVECLVVSEIESRERKCVRSRDLGGTVPAATSGPARVARATEALRERALCVSVHSFANGSIDRTVHATDGFSSTRL